jgi:hypothetical protein
VDAGCTKGTWVCQCRDPFASVDHASLIGTKVQIFRSQPEPKQWTWGKVLKSTGAQLLVEYDVNMRLTTSWFRVAGGHVRPLPKSADVTPDQHDHMSACPLLLLRALVMSRGIEAIMNVASAYPVTGSLTPDRRSHRGSLSATPTPPTFSLASSGGGSSPASTSHGTYTGTYAGSASGSGSTSGSGSVTTGSGSGSNSNSNSNSAGGGGSHARTASPFTSPVAAGAASFDRVHSRSSSGSGAGISTGLTPPPSPSLMVSSITIQSQSFIDEYTIRLLWIIEVFLRGGHGARCVGELSAREAKDTKPPVNFLLNAIDTIAKSRPISRDMIRSLFGILVAQDPTPGSKRTQQEINDKELSNVEPFADSEFWVLQVLVNAFTKATLKDSTSGLEHLNWMLIKVETNCRTFLKQPGQCLQSALDSIAL